MVQNTLKAFIFHLAACFVAFLLLQPFTPYVDDQMTLSINTYLFVIFLLVVGFYVWAGTNLTPLSSPRKDLLSVITVAVPGLIMWFSFSFLTGHGDLDWIFFFLYYQSIRPLGELFSINSHSVQLVFNFVVALLPSLFMGIGLKMTQKKNK